MATARGIAPVPKSVEDPGLRRLLQDLRTAALRTPVAVVAEAPAPGPGLALGLRDEAEEILLDHNPSTPEPLSSTVWRAVPAFSRELSAADDGKIMLIQLSVTQGTEASTDDYPSDIEWAVRAGDFRALPDGTTTDAFNTARWGHTFPVLLESGGRGTSIGISKGPNGVMMLRTSTLTVNRLARLRVRLPAGVVVAQEGEPTGLDRVDLGVVPRAAQVEITSTGGRGALIPGATRALAGVLTAQDFATLQGILAHLSMAASEEARLSTVAPDQALGTGLTPEPADGSWYRTTFTLEIVDLDAGGVVRAAYPDRRALVVGTERPTAGQMLDDTSSVVVGTYEAGTPPVTVTVRAAIDADGSLLVSSSAAAGTTLLVTLSFRQSLIAALARTSLTGAVRRTDLATLVNAAAADAERLSYTSALKDTPTIPAAYTDAQADARANARIAALVSVLGLDATTDAAAGAEIIRLLTIRTGAARLPGSAVAGLATVTSTAVASQTALDAIVTTDRVAFAVVTAAFGSWAQGDILLYDHGDSAWERVGTSTGTAAATDLTVGTRTGTTMVVVSSSGDDVTLPAATATQAGLYPSADREKVRGVAAGAEVNPPPGTVAEATAGSVTLERVWTPKVLHDGAVAIGDGRYNRRATEELRITLSGTFSPAASGADRTITQAEWRRYQAIQITGSMTGMSASNPFVLEVPDADHIGSRRAIVVFGSGYHIKVLTHSRILAQGRGFSGGSALNLRSGDAGLMYIKRTTEARWFSDDRGIVGRFVTPSIPLDGTDAQATSGTNPTTRPSRTWTPARLWAAARAAVRWGDVTGRPGNAVNSDADNATSGFRIWSGALIRRAARAAIRLQDVTGLPASLGHELLYLAPGRQGLTASSRSYSLTAAQALQYRHIQIDPGFTYSPGTAPFTLIFPSGANYWWFVQNLTTRPLLMRRPGASGTITIPTELTAFTTSTGVGVNIFGGVYRVNLNGVLQGISTIDVRP